MLVAGGFSSIALVGSGSHCDKRNFFVARDGYARLTGTSANVSEQSQSMIEKKNLRRAPRPRRRRHPGRRQLARARLESGRRRDAFHRAVATGAYAVRCRRQSLHRLRRLLRSRDPRPRPSGGRRRDRRAGRPRLRLSALRPSWKSRLAERIAAAIPMARKVRLVSSGTEAGMTAIRLARAATGRTGIIKFDGCYHGHSDALLVRAGSGVMTLGVPDSAGVPEALAALTRVAPVQLAGGGRALFLAEPRRNRGGDRRAGRGQHGRGAARAGLPQGPRRPCASPRRAAHLRRSDHRLSPALRCRVRTVMAPSPT